MLADRKSSDIASPVYDIADLRLINADAVYQHADKNQNIEIQNQRSKNSAAGRN